jgi:AcrR family transcriptional regulator
MVAQVMPLRSRARDGEATRDAILAAAAALLASGGEEGLSIRELCARAGVTAPTVYHHFGDKASLVARVIGSCFEEFDRAAAAAGAPGDPVAALRWAFDRYVEYGHAHPSHYRVLFARRQARPSAAAASSYDRLLQRVRAVAEAGRLRSSVGDAAAAFWAAVHGVTSLLIAGFAPPLGPAAVALVRDAMLAQLTTDAPVRRSRTISDDDHA